ncbi:MAG: glycosyltransferase family 4 protein [Acidobacteria bacterium]|nr:glycosyltransferase family 4 protein [Acidobacteriota bacterium]
MNQGDKSKVAYILKNFPKLSETFIASEIYRLERLGVDLKLLVIKPPAEDIRHAVIEKIRAKPFYLPATTSLSETSLAKWLQMHLPVFWLSLIGVCGENPRGTLRAARFALVQSIRARRAFFAWPRKVYLKEFLQATAMAEKILADKEVRHIHAHFAHGATTVAWMTAMITGLKFSFTAHAKDIYLESLNPANLLARKMDAAEFVVTCTEANRTHLQALSRTTVHCLYHGLTVDFSDLVNECKEPRHERNGHIRALAVGRLIEKKGLDTFVEACSILKEKNVNFEAVIVGESGDAEVKIRRSLVKNDLSDKVELTGAMSQTELFAQYRRADVFCLPCRILENGDRDGIPNVMVEAMACGVPVVTTNVSGIPEIIRNGENGLLVNPDDPQALADSLEKIYLDKSLSARLSRAGLDTVKERFDGEISAHKLAKLFSPASLRN